VKAYNSIFFKTKVVLLVLAAINAIAFERGIYRKVDKWDNALIPPMEARIAGWLRTKRARCPRPASRQDSNGSKDAAR